MSCAKNHLNKQKVKTQSVSRFTDNTILLVKLYLSQVSEADDDGMLITIVKENHKTEKRIPFKFEHPGDFGFLQLSYIGPRFNRYFPPDVTVKVSEILLKKSSTTYGNVHDDDWDIIHIITKKENDCNYLLKKAIEDNYTVILTILLKIIDANNSSRQLVFYQYGSLLHRAVARKDMKIIETFLKFKLDINAKNSAGWTSLHVAVDLELSDIVDLLIRNRANVNAENHKHQTPLHFAAKKNNLKILDSLLKKGIKLDVKDKDNQTPLHYAVDVGNVDVVNILLTEGANYKLQDKLYRTPIHLAVQLNNWDIIEIFLKHKIDVNILNSRGQTPLFYLSEKPTLPKAVHKEKYLKIIDALVKKKININFQNSEGYNILHYAVINNNIGCLQALLECNIDVNAVDVKGRTPLHLAVEKKNRGAVELILKKNPKINMMDQHRNTALYLAVESECLPIIELLLKNGANVLLENSSGKTTLHATMYLKNKSIILKCVKVLLYHAADINAVDKDLTSPLHLACLIKNAKIVKYLIENGADSSMRDRFGRTVFHYACMPACKGITLGIGYTKTYVKDTLDVLFKENISVNCVDMSGKTPLHYVVKHENLSFMNKLLLNIGADINIMDKDHLSPFDYLYKQSFYPKNGSSELATLYKQHVVKMKVMKLWVRERILNRIYKAYNERHLNWIQSYEHACKREIDSMKIIHLAQSNITYYDFFKKSPHDAVNNTRNPNAVAVIQSGKLTPMFPSYSHFLKCHLREVLLRRNLYDQIQKSLKPCIFKKLPLPCMNGILKYLDNSDLIIFLKAMKPTLVK